MALRPDPTFHPSPKLAMEAPPEDFAYTVLLSGDLSKPDALAVIDVKPGSPTYSQMVHTVTMPYKGDEFHHFGWNACSSALSPLTGHAFLERRYLIIPGMRSSRIYVVDTKPHPTRRGSTRSSNLRKSSARQAIRGPTPSIAGRKEFTSAHSVAAGRMAPTAPPASSSWTARLSMSSAAGKSIAGCRRNTTISGGTCRATTWCRASGRCRRNSRTGSSRRIFCRTSMGTESTSGICEPGATCRRSISAPIIRWRSKCGLRTIRSGNTVSSASWSTRQTLKARSGPGGAKAGSSTSRRQQRSRQSPRRRSNSAVAAGIWRGAAARYRHRPLHRRQVPLRRLLGNRRDASVRRHRAEEAKAHGIRPYRRHRPAHAPSERQSLCGWPADGRDQPRRQAGLLDQLALFHLGQSILSRWRARGRGHGDRLSQPAA